MPPSPSGNERSGAPGQPAVVVDRRVRAPADHLAEAAVPWLLAGASLQVCEAFSFQVHVHVVETKPGPVVGRGHVREPSWEQLPVQMVVVSIHPLHREANTAPVDDIRHEEVRDPMQVHLGRHPPGGGLVLVFLRQDLPLRGAGQVRSVVGELVTGPRAVAGGRCSIGLVGPSSGVSPRAARAAEGVPKHFRAHVLTSPRPWRSAWAGEIATCSLQ